MRDGSPTHGHTMLELLWTGIPVIIVVFFGTWGAKVLDDNEAHASNARVISVIAYSFDFEYRYDSDGGFIRNDGLYVPVDEAITMHMITPRFTPGTTKLEVIHGFWVPEWGVKQDATPGVTGKRVGTTWVTPTRIGTYEVQCTELCGSRTRRDALQEHPRALEARLREVAGRRQAGGGQGQGRGHGQPGHGGLQRRRLRRLSRLHPRQVQRQDRGRRWTT